MMITADQKSEALTWALSLLAQIRAIVPDDDAVAIAEAERTQAALEAVLADLRRIERPKRTAH